MTEVQLLNSIDEATQKVSLKRLESYSRKTGFSIELKSLDEIDIIDYSMVVILISGESIHQTFKIFFDPSRSFKLLDQIYKNKVDNEVELICDFFKEVANLTAGQIRSLLEKSGLRCEISLPILLRAYDELFFNPKDQVNNLTTYWMMTSQDMKLYFSSSIQLFDKSKNINFKFEDEDGNVEFF